MSPEMPACGKECFQIKDDHRALFGVEMVESATSAWIHSPKDAVTGIAAQPGLKSLRENWNLWGGLSGLVVLGTLSMGLRPMLV